MVRSLALLAIAGTLAASPGEPKPGTGVIEGTVLNQLTSEPIKKAVVRLGGAGSSMSAVTDAGGHFVFRRLPPGPYWLSATCEEYVPPELDAASPTMITLADDEHKAGVELPLVHQASIAGRVLDEFGMPVTGCEVIALQYSYDQGERRLAIRANAGTNQKGEYNLRRLQQGRYYLYLRCYGQFPAPHPLLPRGDPRVPLQIYAPQFYPGVPDANGATKVAVTPGAALKGLDFQARRSTGVTVSGHLAGMESGAAGEQIQMTLVPRGTATTDLASNSAQINPGKGSFQFRGVLPGSYLLVVSAYVNEKLAYYAKVPVEVGDAPPEPLEISLSAVQEISGTLETERETTPTAPQSAQGSFVSRPKREAQIALLPLERGQVSQVPTTVPDGGAFTLSGVTPGRWRLNVMNMPGFVKSFTIGDQAVSPYSFEVGAGQGGPWRIVFSNRIAKVDVSVSGTLPPERDSVSVLLVPENPQYLGAGIETTVSADEKGHATFSVRPGRFRVYAVESRNAWRLLQRQHALQALNHRSETVDVEEGGQAQVSLGLIRADELNRALQDDNE
jgi:hypothetical protein